MWFVYLLLCDNDTFYTGIAKDVNKRFMVHQKGRGARYTKIYKPLKIVYQEQVDSHQIAIKRELEIKSWSRQKKITTLNLLSFITTND